MDGFVTSYTQTGRNGSVIMDCFSPSHVPVITTLASEFALFDEYFAGVPGPTFPNRLFSMSATSDGYGDNSGARTAGGGRTLCRALIERFPPRVSPFDLCSRLAAGPDLPAPRRGQRQLAGLLSGRSHVPAFPGSARERGSHAPSASAALPAPPTGLQYTRSNESLRKHHFFDKFYTDAAAGDLPSFTWLDPAYLDDPPFHNATDQHPAHDVALGEAVRARSPGWSRVRTRAIV